MTHHSGITVKVAKKTFSFFAQTSCCIIFTPLWCQGTEECPSSQCFQWGPMSAPACLEMGLDWGCLCPACPPSPCRAGTGGTVKTGAVETHFGEAPLQCGWGGVQKCPWWCVQSMKSLPDSASPDGADMWKGSPFTTAGPKKPCVPERASTKHLSELFPHLPVLSAIQLL